MVKTRLSVLALWCVMGLGGVYAKPVHLRCDLLTNPLGIDDSKPRLSWRSDSDEHNWRQSAYQIQVASTLDKLKAGQADVWDSGKQASGESAGIAYAGPALQSRKQYFWTVTVWDAKGHSTQAGEPARWEMGLLEKSDWQAKWIRWQNPEAADDRAGIHWIWIPGQDAAAAPAGTRAVFRTSLDLAELPERAALFLIARGDWKVTVNGKDAGAKPHWYEFDRRDLAGLLVKGHNTIEVSVFVPADLEFTPFPVAQNAPRPAALAALVKIRLPGGEIRRIPSDAKWEARLEANPTWTPAVIAGDLGDARFHGDPGPLPQPAALLRKSFTVAKSVIRARAYVTALGGYQFTINGEHVGPGVLAPGFTQFDKRVQYQTYDVTALVASDENVLAATLAEGWFGSGLSWTALHFSVGPPTRFLAQVELEYSDGTRGTIATGEGWKAAGSPVIHAEIYAGETYDARLEQPGWNRKGFDDAHWAAAAAAEENYPGEVSSQIDALPEVVKTLRPERVTPMPDGAYVFDMGQNMVGWVKLKVQGARGTAVRLRFAEILNPNGSIYTTNLRNADATDTYTLRGGGGEETYAPRFTFHGFRYVEVSGYPGTPNLDTVTGEVVSSVSGEPTAHIETSSDLVNRMWQIGIWGQRGNFLSVPTDCPQRDERLGWMADAAVFWRTGSYNFDIGAFTRKWLRDVRDAQLPDGAFTNVSPNIGLGDLAGAPGWGDAGVIVPWTQWQQYGDTGAVEQNWDAMERWMTFIENANPNYIRKQKVGPDFADWLAPDPNTPKDLVDTAYWALIAQMMGDMARASNRLDAAKKYAGVYDNIRAAFQKEYLKPDGTLTGNSQTAYVVALQMKLLPPASEGAAVTNLVNSINAHDGHLTTGFLGTPYILFALANHGRTDVAYQLLLNDTYPSWGYMLKKGATTWWERWNGDTGDPAMNSYNHYAFGSVVAWIYQCIAGIDTALTGPGFHEIVIQPRLDARLTEARGRYESVYGLITSEWKGTPAGPFDLKVTIPANTTASVILPRIPNTKVQQDGKSAHVEERPEGRFVRIGSGSYEFTVR